jgi:glycerol-3-phosphate dehydrogenase
MLRPTKGIHIVVDRKTLDVKHVVVHSAPDGRMVFAVPFGAFTYIGTTDTDYDGSLDDVHADDEDVSYLLQSVNDLFEGAPIDRRDIVSTWAGLRPLVNGEGTPAKLSRDYRIAVADNGLVTVFGGKLTTHRSTAEAVLDDVVERFGDRFTQRVSECRTKDVPLYGGDIADFQRYAAAELHAVSDRFGPSPTVVARLLRHYGTDYLKVLSLGLIHRSFLEPLSWGDDVLKGEVLHAVEDEMAMTLEDFMDRRTEMMQFDRRRAVKAAETVAGLMAARLQWDASERRRQLEAYREAVAKSVAFRADALAVD